MGIQREPRQIRRICGSTHRSAHRSRCRPSFLEHRTLALFLLLARRMQGFRTCLRIEAYTRTRGSLAFSFRNLPSFNSCSTTILARLVKDSVLVIQVWHASRSRTGIARNRFNFLAAVFACEPERCDWFGWFVGAWFHVVANFISRSMTSLDVWPSHFGAWSHTFAPHRTHASQSLSGMWYETVPSGRSIPTMNHPGMNVPLSCRFDIHIGKIPAWHESKHRNKACRCSYSSLNVWYPSDVSPVILHCSHAASASLAVNLAGPTAWQFPQYADTGNPIVSAGYMSVDLQNGQGVISLTSSRRIQIEKCRKRRT